MKHEVLRFRAQVMRAVRSFFEEREYLEVDTPVRVKTPALEDHIEAEASGDHWLRTSPELHMKRMMCAGYEKIFQIGPCFRQGERGHHHLPEYTMLEWYREGAESSDLISETLELLRTVAAGVNQPESGGLHRAAKRISVSEIFLDQAGWDPVESFDSTRFDLDVVEKVEPWIEQQNCPVILKDFPKPRAALARLQPEDSSVADRWELYLGGLELANAYTELTDPVEQRRRFVDCATLRQAEGREVYPLDEDFLAALEEGMPACAGIALGIDRFLMVLTGMEDISDVVAFPES